MSSSAVFRLSSYHVSNFTLLCWPKKSLLSHPPSTIRGKSKMQKRPLWQKETLFLLSFPFVKVHSFYFILVLFLKQSYLHINPSSLSLQSSRTPIFSPPHSLSTSQPGWGLPWGANKVCHITWDRAKAFTLVSKLSKVFFYRQWAPKSKFMHQG